MAGRDEVEVAGEERRAGCVFFAAGRMKLKRVLGLAFVAFFLGVALGMLVKMGVREKETDGGRRLL